MTPPTHTAAPDVLTDLPIDFKVRIYFESGELREMKPSQIDALFAGAAKVLRAANDVREQIGEHSDAR